VGKAAILGPHFATLLKKHQLVLACARSKFKFSLSSSAVDSILSEMPSKQGQEKTLPQMQWLA
jgi:hypothetical protein